MEWKAKSKGKISIPDELAEANFLVRSEWAWHGYREAPHHIIEQMVFIWHLQDLMDEKVNGGK